MRIEKLSTRFLRTPVESAVVNVTKTRAFMEIILLEVYTDEGIVGHGYSYTDGFGGRAIKHLLDTDIAELVVGLDPMNVEGINQKVLWEIRQAGFSGITVLANAALNLALWDIYSQKTALPIGEIFGKFHEKVPMYASVAGWLGLPIPEMVERAAELVKEKKMNGIKIQVARGPLERDALRLKSLREALGDEIKLFVDANTIMDVPTAIRLGKRIEEYDIFWMEEPISLRDKDGHALLQQSINIPLANGENFFSAAECDDYICRRLVSYMQADVVRIGGPSQWLKVARLAEVHNIKMSPHFVMEVSTQLQCCIPNSLFVEYIPWFQSFFKEPIRIQDGYAYPREKPGLGLAFKDEVIEKFEIL